MLLLFRIHSDPAEQERFLYLEIGKLSFPEIDRHKPSAFMALNKKVYGVKQPISPRIFRVHGVFD